MPELPEVNTVKQGFHDTVLNLEVMDVEVYDDKILRNVSSSDFVTTLLGQRFIDTYRQGKYFFGILDNGIHVLFHLGMTGDLVYYMEQTDRPKYERFSIAFSNGLLLGYQDPRKFSNISIIENLETYLQKIQLGPDALVISRPHFQSIFAGRKTSVKAILLNQQLVAGIGNLYADEICYQAKIHPGSKAGALTKIQLNRMHNRMQDILNEACTREAYYQVYPDDWFWQWRTDQTDYLEGKGPVRKQKIAGRTTYFVEGYQQLIT